MSETWIKHPTVLEGQFVKLVPVEKEHLPELFQLASDKRLWLYYPTDCSDEQKFYTSYNTAMADREKGTNYPFAILHKETGKLIGSTRLMDIVHVHKKLEIGFTWLIQQYWGTAINFECKLLLMTFAFEQLKATRVQLKTDENNIRSRTAIQKIGGKFDGVLRKDILRDNGIYRSSAYYSILDDEWQEARSKILEQFEERLVK